MTGFDDPRSGFETSVRRCRLWALCVAIAFWLMPATIASAASFLPGGKETYKVFVIGDSLAGGLWAGLSRQIQDEERLSVTGRFKEESGLARPEIYDWPRALKGILERNQFDIAIIMIGVNDGRDIRRGDERFSYGSEQWTRAYLENVESLLTVLRRANVAVYWVGLPPMLSRDIDNVARTVTGLQRQAVDRAAIRFIDIRARFANPDGSYTDSGTDVNGEFTRLRSRNGVNLLRSGNDKLANMVLEVLRADMAAAEGIVAGGESAQGGDFAQRSRQQSYDGPIFGKALASGEAIQIHPADLPSQDAVAVARRPVAADTVAVSGKDASPMAAGQRPQAPPGSEAERLFDTGQWPKAEPGRIDDFSVAQ